MNTDLPLVVGECCSSVRVCVFSSSCNALHVVESKSLGKWFRLDVVVVEYDLVEQRCYFGGAGKIFCL